jgi:hypothetical protein
VHSASEVNSTFVDVARRHLAIRKRVREAQEKSLARSACWFGFLRGFAAFGVAIPHVFIAMNIRPELFETLPRY